MSKSLIILGCSFTAIICAAAQFFVKKLVNQRQYSYFKDLLLAGVLVLTSLWFGDPTSSNARAVAGAAFLACVVGLAESFYYEHKAARVFAYLVIAMLCAFFGPAINFIRLNTGEYIYLTPLMSTYHNNRDI